MAIVFAGANERLEDEQRARAWLAWHTAALPRMQKFPELSSLTGLSRKVRAQTPEEIEANILAVFGAL